MCNFVISMICSLLHVKTLEEDIKQNKLNIGLQTEGVNVKYRKCVAV